MRLSIIVPIYKVQVYLSECIDSLLAQTYTDMEIILVDDGSPDDCGCICDEYKERYGDRISVIHQTNGGLPAARNAGLAVANGEYVGFFDSDDIADSLMYEKLMNAIESGQYDMAVCNMLVFNKSGKDILSQRYGNTVMGKQTDTLSYFSSGMDSSCNRVYRMQIIRDNGLWFEDKHIVAQEDYWFLVRYLSHANRVVTIADALYGYRERKSSISKARTDLDVTDRNIVFLNKTENYTAKFAGVDCDLFMQYQTLNLFFAAINNSGGDKIETICRKFFTESWLKAALYNNQITAFYICGGVRSAYNRILFFLLRRKAWRLFSTLESIRVKRLCSNHRKDLYFD